MKRKTDKLMKMYDKKLKQLYKKCVANKFNQDIMAEFFVCRLTYARDYFALNYQQDYQEKIVSMSAAIAEYEAYQVEFAACCEDLDQQSPEEMAALVGNIAENKSFKKKLDSLENHRKMFWAIVAEKSPEWDI